MVEEKQNDDMFLNVFSFIHFFLRCCVAVLCYNKANKYMLK